MNQISFDVQFEKAVRFLIKYAPVSDESTKKSMVPHDIRVGVYLFNHGYSKDIVLAGILHDTIEFTEVTEKMLKDEFGDVVTKLVLANSKDRSIKNSDERIDELVKRCSENGKDSLIIKAVDTIDSYIHYTKTNNVGELDYCKKNALAVFKYMPVDCEDLVFDVLREWLEKQKNTHQGESIWNR